MLRSLTTAATGMMAQQMNIDVISNNLANVNTTGYKKVRAEFQDLLSQTLKSSGAQIFQGTTQPVGIQIGLGTKNSATVREFSEGAFKSTGGKLDMAIEGDGFFQVLMDDGTIAYTRDGTFKTDSNGQVTTTDGFIVQPAISIPTDTQEITITPDGRVSIKAAGDNSQTEIGKITLVKFSNPAGLSSLGKNLFAETTASGKPIEGPPGQNGFGTVQQGFVESANVQVVEELINLIQAERAFEANSKLIRASDELLQTLNRMS
jgi:flagellar basal-body rod protein FlgG